MMRIFILMVDFIFTRVVMWVFVVTLTTRFNVGEEEGFESAAACGKHEAIHLLLNESEERVVNILSRELKRESGD